MTRSRREVADELLAAWDASSQAPTSGDVEFALHARVGHHFAASSRDGLRAVVLPLAAGPRDAAGRRAAGFELMPHIRLRFDYGGRSWEGPAAALICREETLLDTFAVLAADISARFFDEPPTWKAVLDVVEEWQSLLGRKGRMTPEGELGLWGELWLIDLATDVDRLFQAWLGPSGDAQDFFLDGVGIEVKTGRQRGSHHVSQTQVGRPVGSYPAWLLSLWVKPDPIAGTSLAALASRVVARSAQPESVVRQLAAAGYNPADREEYATGLVVLREPEWFPASAVPRVREADPGVSQLRYRIALDPATRADSQTEGLCWRHALGRVYEGATHETR